jgi:hypothetical protein
MRDRLVLAFLLWQMPLCLGGSLLSSALICCSKKDLKGKKHEFPNSEVISVVLPVGPQSKWKSQSKVKREVGLCSAPVL